VLSWFLRSAVYAICVSCFFFSAAYAGPATHLQIVIADPSVVFTNVQVTVNALDSSEAIDTTFNGTIAFTSSDPSFVTPANLTLVNGNSFENGASFKTAGTQTVTGTDTVNSAINGTTSTLVLAGPTTGVVLTVPSSTTPGVPFTFTATASDLFGNVTPLYTGTLHFTSSDGAAVLPANSSLTNGTGTFTATFNTPMQQSITATDTVNPSITGSSDTTTAPVRLQSIDVE
jgi:hypothetical protein